MQADDLVEAALAALGAAASAEAADEARDQFLWAVGDALHGTYQPVVLSTLPALAQILAAGGPWAQQAVLETLIDLGGPFVPAAGLELQAGVDVRAALRAFLQTLRPSVQTLTAGDDACAGSAAELLELIDDLGDLLPNIGA